MSPELTDLLLKALYAGHKYHLAVQTTMDDVRSGQVPTSENSDLVSRYYAEWLEYTAQAVELHAKEGGP
jgi:hypothetical protein